MKKNLTELVFILDKSGSMAGLERDTIGGYELPAVAGLLPLNGLLHLCGGVFAAGVLFAVGDDHKHHLSGAKGLRRVFLRSCDFMNRFAHGVQQGAGFLKRKVARQRLRGLRRVKTFDRVRLQLLGLNCKIFVKTAYRGDFPGSGRCHEPILRLAAALVFDLVAREEGQVLVDVAERHRGDDCKVHM